MARSQLLKDLVSGTGELENVLLRLKIILTDLDNEKIMTWVLGELEGYDGRDVPDYRVVEGVQFGTFLVNGGIRYDNKSVPLEHLIPEEKIEKMITTEFRDNISSIQNNLSGEDRNNYVKNIPTAFCHAISTYELQILTMEIRYPSNRIDGIVSKVKSKLVDIIMELEKQFDNLDDLDIKSQIEDDGQKRKSVVYNIEQIIYEGAIEIGDENKIKGSRIGNFLSGKK